MVTQCKVDRMTEGIVSKINATREERGMSIRTLSSESGVSLQNLYRIMRGEQTPTLDVLVRIATALNMALSLEPLQDTAKR